MVSVCLTSDAHLQHLLSSLGFSYLGHRVTLHGCSSKAQLLFLILDKGYFLTVAPSDLQRGIAPLGPPAPAQPPLLGHVVAPPCRCHWPRTWVAPLSCSCASAAWHSQPPPLFSNNLFPYLLFCNRSSRISLSHQFLLQVFNPVNQGLAAVSKALQSCPTLCDPIDGSPPGSPIPGILQARTLEWVAIAFSNAWKWKWSRSVMIGFGYPISISDGNEEKGRTGRM